MDRERFFDINKLSEQEAEALATQLGNKTREMADEAAEKMNKLLNVYGMKAKFQLVILPINEPDKPAPKKRKSRKQS
jgi:fructose-1,6-bisphosphatase/sedoheptulose 1,7-bisphosphatase-like protein